MAGKSANVTKEEMDSLADLYKFLTFIAVALGLTMYLQLLKNRSHWVIMEMVLGAISLAMFPFATYVIPNYFTSGYDTLSIYLFRVMILAKTAQTVSIYLTRNCKDPTVSISVSISNILTRGLLIFCVLHGIFFTTTVWKFAMKCDFICVTLLIIGDLCHLSKLSTREGALTVGDPISLHLSIDALVTFIYGAMLLGFPDMFLSIVNPVLKAKEGHLALVRVIGCSVSGGSILSLASLCFKNADDAIMTLKSKLLLYFPAVLIGAVYYLFDQQYQGPGHTLLLVGVMKALMWNAGYAVYQHEKAKSQ